MAFPVVADSALTQASADQTSHAINLPSGIASGNLLLLWFTMDGAVGNAVTTPSGWTLMQSTIAATNADFGILYCRTADGSEGSTVTITSTGTAQSSAAVCLRITGHSGTVDSQGTSSPTASTGILLATLTPTVSSQALLLTLVNTIGNRDTSEWMTGLTVLKTNATASTVNTIATVTHSVMSISSDLEIVIADGMRQSASSVYSGVIAVVHGGSLGGGSMFLMGGAGQTGIGQF